MKSEITTAIMLFAFGGVMAANSELYWWVKIVGIAAIVMGCISILVGIAVWWSKKQKISVK